MSIWDDEPARQERRPGPTAEPEAPSAAAVAVARLGRAHDNVRLAAQKDAAEIVARARRDIRRVVTEARRELLELSAQVQAANVELNDATLPDPSIIQAEDVPFDTAAGWRTEPLREAAEPVRTSRATPPGRVHEDVDRVPDREDAPGLLVAQPLASPSSARVFVALFAMAGLIVLAGTVWWLSRAPVVTPQVESASLVTPRPAPAPTEPAAGPASAPAGLPVELASNPVTVPAPDVAPVPAPAPALATTPAPVEVPRPPAQVMPAPAPPRSPGAVVPAVPLGTGPMPAPAAAVAPRSNTPARVDIAAFGRQWLDAYHRQDRASMEAVVAPSLVINDERRPDQRFPFGLEVTRAFEDEQLQLSGDSAVFTARMTERASTGALISRVSQTWVRRSGEWQLQEARVSSENPVPAGPR